MIALFYIYFFFSHFDVQEKILLWLILFKASLSHLLITASFTEIDITAVEHALCSAHSVYDSSAVVTVSFFCAVLQTYYPSLRSGGLILPSHISMIKSLQISLSAGLSPDSFFPAKGVTVH